MNRLILMMGLSLMLALPQAWGSTTQYPDPNRQTIWNNVTDGLNTLGQSPQDAMFTKRKLHRERTRARLQSIRQARQRALLNNQN
jgi:hypothetical protein